MRYHTMTSSYFKVFSDLEPGTEITIAGRKYTLKENLILDFFVVAGMVLEAS